MADAFARGVTICWFPHIYGNQKKQNRTLLLAESHLTRRLFADMVAKIATLPSPAG